MKLVCGDFNARLQKCLPGEEEYIGEFVFGNSAAHLDLNSNRELLLQFCASNSMFVANTVFSHEPEEQITFRNVGKPLGTPFSSASHNVLDYFLVGHSHRQGILDVRSLTKEPLASHHYAVVAKLAQDLVVGSLSKNYLRTKRDLSNLKSNQVHRDFCNEFETLLSNQAPTQGDVDQLCSVINDAFAGAEEKALPIAGTSRRKPWISVATLALIDRRRVCRLHGNVEEEKQVCQEIKRSARSDRRVWLNNLAASGSWGAARQLRGRVSKQQGKLNDADGCPVSSEDRAARFAEYLETVQWKVRPAKLVDDVGSLPPLPVDLGPISLSELRRAAKSLKSGKAVGPDDTPIEYWKAVLNSGCSDGAAFLLDFCQAVWSGKKVPQSWHLSRVVLLYKKGDPADCGNYRPVCLLAAAYKIFAMLMLNRLLDAGADARLWPTQYAFRKERGTEDALHCVRRAMELSWAHRGGGLHMLALDWAKAFDSINAESLLQALRKFGIPEPFVQMAQSIYTDRAFVVSECGETSDRRPQLSGICQGCPLSPFLFVIVMTVLMDIARSELSQESLEAIGQHSLYDILYADDTIILGTSAPCVTEIAEAIERAGRQFGMTLHWGKTQALSVCADGGILSPQGDLVEDSGSLVYLGALLTSDGRADSELSRRIGMANGDFKRLSKFWCHAGISRKRKLELLHALVISKLQYGLSTIWLVQAQRRRLDGFYVRCLRKVLGIPAAFYSRVSNKIVLERAGVLPLTEQILKRQLVILGKVARSPADSLLRRCVFRDDSLIPQVGRYVRRVGRPRQDWASQVMRAGAEKFGSTAAFESLLKAEGDDAEKQWRQVLQSLFKR